jgi:hypothetical protein
MYLLLSGEGSSDIGVCYPVSTSCDADTFRAGPMAWIIDQLIEENLGYEFSHLATERVSFVSESYLAQNKQQPISKKSMSLRGKTKPPETKYFFENARALARAAQAKAQEVNDHVIAILFRDTDGVASAGRGLWKDKYDSIIAGFQAEEYQLGVAMLPKPKSEAWLLCAVKENAYMHCASLESESGNDKAPNPLKSQLNVAMNGDSATPTLVNKIKEREIDVFRIDMPSYNQFKDDLRTATIKVIQN